MASVISNRKAISISAVGIGIAQLAPILATPILSRLYDPIDFGDFVLYFGASSILAIGLTFKTDAAIVVVAGNVEAETIAKYVLGSVIINGIIIGSITYAISCIFPEINYLDTNLVIYIILTAVSSSFIYILSSTLIRYKKFSELAYVRAARGFFAAGLTLVFGWLPFSENGLILGTLIAQLITAILLITICFARQTIGQFETRISIIESKKVFYQIKDYITLSTPAAIFNIAALYIPAYGLSFIGSATIGGLYGFVQRSVAIPTSVIGLALSDVTRQRYSELYLQDRIILKQEVDRNIKTSVILGVAILLIGETAIYFAFVPIVGSEWAPSLPIALVMFPVYVCSMVIGPFTSLLYIFNKQHLELFINVAFVAVSTTAMLLYFVEYVNWFESVCLLSVLLQILYVVVIIICRNSVKTNK